MLVVLQGAVAALNSKLSLLDSSNVDAVEARLQSVMHKLGQIADKKASQDNPEKQQRVSNRIIIFQSFFHD
jgi:hypothetical protein